MEKKIYERPVMQVEEFVANQYCAPCGDGETTVTYKFKCDAGGGSSYYVWLDNNIIGGDAEGEWVEQGWGMFTSYEWEGADEYLGRFHACSEGQHTVTVPKGTPIDDIFPLGLISRSQYGVNTTKVRVWRGEDGDNIHCSTHLDTSEYTPHYKFS